MSGAGGTMRPLQLINTARGESVIFGQDGFVLDDYDIRAIGAVHKTYEGYSQNGEYRISSRFQRRQIRLTFHLNATDAETMETKKRHLTRVADPIGEFELCMDKKRILCCADGTAEFSEQAPYRKGLVVEGSLRLICLSPCFYAETPRRAVYGAYEGQLTFPVSLTEEGAIMGYMPAGNTIRLQNDGDVAVGVTVTVTALSDCTCFRMTTLDGEETFLYDRTLAAGQILQFCTEYGKKSATLTDAGTITAALQYVDPSSAFFRLAPGENIFTYDSGGGKCKIELELREQYLI